jgi:hypothetical protein
MHFLHRSIQRLKAVEKSSLAIDLTTPSQLFLKLFYIDVRPASLTFTLAKRKKSPWARSS